MDENLLNLDDFSFMDDKLLVDENSFMDERLL